MIVHGLSHGLAALLCTLGGELVQRVLAEQWPSIYRALHEGVLRILEATAWPMAPDRLADWVLIVILGFIWGAAFKVLND